MPEGLKIILVLGAAFIYARYIVPSRAFDRVTAWLFRMEE